MKNFIPEEFKTYFWDYDISTIDGDLHIEFVTERLIEKGNWETARWLINKLSPEEISNIVENSPNLSKEIANFWSELLK